MNDEVGCIESSEIMGEPLKILTELSNWILTMFGPMYIEVSLTDCSKTIGKPLLSLTMLLKSGLIMPLF